MIPSYMVIVSPLLWMVLQDHLYILIKLHLFIYAITSGTLMLLIGNEPDEVKYDREFNSNKDKPK